MFGQAHRPLIINTHRWLNKFITVIRTGISKLKNDFGGYDSCHGVLAGVKSKFE